MARQEDAVPDDEPGEERGGGHAGHRTRGDGHDAHAGGHAGDGHGRCPTAAQATGAAFDDRGPEADPREQAKHGRARPPADEAELDDPADHRRGDEDDHHGRYRQAAAGRGDPGADDQQVAGHGDGHAGLLDREDGRQDDQGREIHVERRG